MRILQDLFDLLLQFLDGIGRFYLLFFFLVRCQAERSNEEENDDSVRASQEGPSVRSRRERQAISAIHLTSEGTMQVG
jgi:hypothetical protein